jgi:acetyltransferase
LIVGLRNDPQFGPVVIAGLGGVYVEALRDIAFRLLPVTASDALDMLGELRSKKLFGEFRGKPARDMDAVATAISALSEIYLDHREVLDDLEINPLIVLGKGDGVRAVDIRPLWK